MDGPGDYYTKSDKELYDTTYMWNLKKKKKWYNELTFKTEANSKT